jgi:hypothetical protein
MQSYYLNRNHDLKCALQELSIHAEVTGYKCIGDPNVIEIEPNDRYEDGQIINNCLLIFKGE